MNSFGARGPLRVGGREFEAPLVFHLIPHTHWDREWYLARAGFVARLLPMLDDLVVRLEADPSYRTFLLDGQTVLLEDYLSLRPERAPAVGALVAAGRLQTGPWYVLADELIPSGESLVRNLLVGTAQARRLGGRSEALYSPDAFGHPAAWPSLAREFGIDQGVLWRGLGGAQDLIRWRAADGAEVVVYHLPPAGYEIGAALPADAASLARTWPPVRAGLVGRAATRHVAVFVGADHHAAHQSVGRLQTLLAGLEPENGVRISRLDEFLAAAGAELPATEPLGGELRASYGYTWTLQGVHATRAPMKRRAARRELWLERVAEPLAMLARRAGGGDRAPLLASAWRELVQSQFHAAIGGCSADDVAAEVEVRLAAAGATTREIVRGSIHELIGHDPDAARVRDAEATPTLMLWNPAARMREGVVIADVTCFRSDVLVGPPGGRRVRQGGGCGAFALRAEDGSVLPLQIVSRRRALERLDAERHYPDLDEVEIVRVAFRAPAIAGLAFARLTATDPGPADAGVELDGRTMRNALIEVTLEQDGTLSLADRRTGERYRGILALESEADLGDTYTFCPAESGETERSAEPVRVWALSRGPLVAELAARWAFAGVAVRARISLRADESVVRCVFDLDNRARNRRLRLRLPVGIRAMSAIAGTAFGTLTRPVEPAPACAAETPVRTAPAHRLVAAALGARGLAVFAPGFFEYEWTGSELLFTLLRSVGDLSRGDLRTRPGHAGWATATPSAQCIGPDRVELAIGPVTEDQIARPDLLWAQWEDVILPISGTWLRDAIGFGPASPAVELMGDGLVLSAVKQAEDGDGAILRCYNARDVAVDGAWRVAPVPGQAERSFADERPGSAVTIGADGRVAFRAEPRQIVTIRIR